MPVPLAVRVSHPVALLAVFVFTHGPRSARACGSSGDYVDTLLPASGAQEVPLDAALIAASSIEDIRFSLRTVAGDPDAGSVDVPFEPTCYAGQQGAVCVALPVEALQPSTQYEWKAEVVGDHVSYSSSDGINVGGTTAVWRLFTTAASEQSGTVHALDVELTRNVVLQYQLCGTTASATFRFGSDEPPSGPLLVGFAGVTPGFGTSLRRFEPGEDGGMDVNLNNPPDCVVPELYDARGRRTELPQICPKETLPPVLVDSTGQPVPSDPTPTTATPVAVEPSSVGESQPLPTAQPSNVNETAPGSELRAVDPESGSKCSASIGDGPSAWWLLSGALVAWRRRRRSAVIASAASFPSITHRSAS